MDNLEVVIETTGVDGNHAGWMIFCPGCKSGHVFDARWDFNGNRTRPTFNPSMLVDGNRPERRCHSYVRDGSIQFLSDCFHELKNKTVPLQPFTFDQGVSG